jgi:cob(I)alamin adenosyltransferase
VSLLSSEVKINKHSLVYLNRLSDLLVVLSRVLNENGLNDVLWVPGANQK